MGLRTKHKVGPNDPCPCNSGLKSKKCHADPLKIAVCERVVQEKMLKLIRAEQRKQVIALQQKECETCGHTGRDKKYDAMSASYYIEPCLDCQFISDEERNAEIYRRKTNEKEIS